MKDKLKSFFTEHWKYMAVSAACKLNLFDHLQEFQTATQLSKQLSLNEENVLLLLNALHKIEFLDKQDKSFKNNEASVFLTDGHSGSLKYACMNWSEEHLHAWQNLDYTIATGKSSFEKSYGLKFFDYLNEYPEKLDAYHKAMYQYAVEDYKSLPDLIDFQQYHSVMDVGGGYGALLENLKRKNSNIDCFLFDLEKVVDKVSARNLVKVSGDFFDEIPSIAEAIILSRVLHDWKNDEASLILKNCFDALPDKGILYLIENCEDRIEIDLSLLSLNMKAMCESYERTAQEYINLTEKAGFRLQGEVNLNELQTVLIFEK